MEFSKGQKSLEMVIGLVILLVVAGTVISVFLGQFDEGVGEQFEGELEMQEIERTCESSCSEFRQRSGIEGTSAAVEYCTQRFESDVTGDGTTSNVAGTLYNSYCEDGIKCFNVHECEVGMETLDASSCAEVMEDYYTSDQIGMSTTETREEIAEWYNPVDTEGDKGVGSCDLHEVEEFTWLDGINEDYNLEEHWSDGIPTSTDDEETVDPLGEPGS